MIVEDDDLMQHILAEFFTDLGGNCVAFVTADDALVHLLQQPTLPQLIVADFTLPGQIDGKEFALMVNQRWPAVPVLLISAYGSEIASGLPKGIGFLQKPWTTEQLAQFVRKHVAD